MNADPGASYRRVQDLIETEPGQILLKGERFLLVNAKALGTLRRDLVSTLGWDRARGFLLRYGWSCGYNDALSVRQQYPDRSERFWMLQGRLLHMLEGVTRVEPLRIEVDPPRHRFYFEGIWTNSYEAVQHRQHFGLAPDPVCWTLVGYAGGYTTGVFGRQILYKEVACVGRGDPHCRYVGQTIDAWGAEIESELPFYGETKIAEELEEAHRSIQQQHQLLKQIMGMHEELTRLVLEGHGRQTVVETVGRMVNAPVLAEDRRLRPLAGWFPPAGPGAAQDGWLGACADESPALRRRLQRIQREKRSADLGPADHARLSARTIAPIVLGREVAGYLSVIHRPGVSDELRRMIAERAAAVMGLVLLNERTALETEHRLRGELIDELLSGAVPVESVRSRALYMGHDLDRPHRWLLVQIDGGAPRGQRGNAQERLLSLRQELFDTIRGVVGGTPHQALVVERGDGILVLARSGPDGLQCQQAAQAIQRRFRAVRPRHPVSISISRETHSIEQLQPAFAECRANLETLARLGRVGEIVVAEEVNTFDLMYAGSTREQMVACARRLLARVLAYDQEHGGQLVQTLHTFLANEGNVHETARELNISPNGVKYRLQRLQEVGELDLGNRDVRFHLQLALRVLAASGDVKLVV